MKYTQYFGPTTSTTMMTTASSTKLNREETLYGWKCRGGSRNERGRHRVIRRERERTHTNMTKKREKLNSKTWRKQKHEHYINGCDCVDNDDNTVENHKICYVSNRWWMVKAMHITRYSLTISATHATQGTKIRFLSLFELTRWSFVSSTLCRIELCTTTVPKSTDYQQPKM